MSPNDIEVLIHYHCSPEPHPREHAPAVRAAINKFLADDILMPCLLLPSCYLVPGGEEYHVQRFTYTTTEKGKAWLEMILATPYPEHAWVDPRTNQPGPDYASIAQAQGIL